MGEQLAKAHGRALIDKPESDWLPIVKNVAIDGMMEMIRADLAALNIRHEHFFSERTLHAADHGVSPIDAAIDWLRGRGLVYEGRLPPPKGQLPDDWEDREQTLFKSTDFGDDVDRALKKSNGAPTYFAADIAYHKDKIDRGYDTLVDIWGADHGGYVKRMNAAVAALSDGKVKLDVKLCQLVKLMRNGEPVKMSKRAGDFVTLREVVDEGADFVLLDNMNVEQMREAVKIAKGKVKLEASGGINRNTVKEIAETGVDLISSGALTHSAPILDLGLDIEIGS